MDADGRAEEEEDDDYDDDYDDTVHSLDAEVELAKL